MDAYHCTGEWKRVCVRAEVSAMEVATGSSSMCVCLLTYVRKGAVALAAVLQWRF